MAKPLEALGSGQQTPKEEYKIFNDSVHGHIKMHPLLVDIIDTPAFQRLRNIKQMGGIYFVFPGASHNRFEHSIGVSHLAGELIRSLKAQGQDISSVHMFCVQIAGLCHDLGHGPFSHLFEEVLKELSENLVLKKERRKTLKIWKHEAQSCKMFDLLIKNEIRKKMLDGNYKDEEGQKLIFTKEHIELIHELIKGTKEGQEEDKSYLYEIVANKCTGIDVDKMDYISRDCLHLGMKTNFSHERFMMFARVCTDEDGKKRICTRDKEAINMYKLFHERYMLHYTVCNHTVKVAIETMIVDALLAAEGHFKLGEKTISEAVEDDETFLKLTDNILMEIMWSKDPTKAKEIIERIMKRKLYKLVESKIFQTKDLEHLKEATSSDLKAVVKEWLEHMRAQSQKEIMTSHSMSHSASQHDEWQHWIKNEDRDETCFALKLVELNYGKGEEDPINYLRFYRKKTQDIAEKLDEKEVSHMLPQVFSETKAMLFYKGLDKLPEKCSLQELWDKLKEVRS